MEAGYRVAVTADVPMTLTPDGRRIEAREHCQRSGEHQRRRHSGGARSRRDRLHGGTKLADLKPSASNMVDTLFDKLKRSNQVKIGVVPFAEYVNIGKSNGAQKWVEKTTDYQATVSQCSWRRVKGRGSGSAKNVVRNFRGMAASARAITRSTSGTKTICCSQSPACSTSTARRRSSRSRQAAQAAPEQGRRVLGHQRSDRRRRDLSSGG